MKTPPRARQLPHIRGTARAAEAYRLIQDSLEIDRVYDADQYEAMDLTLRLLAYSPELRAALFPDDMPAGELLSCLRAAGVDNWDGYPIAMRIAKERGHPWARVYDEDEDDWDEEQ